MYVVHNRWCVLYREDYNCRPSAVCRAKRGGGRPLTVWDCHGDRPTICASAIARNWTRPHARIQASKARCRKWQAESEQRRRLPRRRRRCSLSACHVGHLAFDGQPGSYLDAREGVSNCISANIALVGVYADSWSVAAAVPDADWDEWFAPPSPASNVNSDSD